MIFGLSVYLVMHIQWQSTMEVDSCCAYPVLEHNRYTNQASFSGYEQTYPSYSVQTHTLTRMDHNMQYELGRDAYSA